MKSSLFGLALLGLAIITNCKKENSSSVKQDRIWTEYTLEYDSLQDKTFARALFRFGNITGTVLELSSPSEVRFNGDLLTKNQVLGLYTLDLAGKHDTGSFVFKDTEGKTFTNRLETAEYIQWPTNEDTFTTTKSQTVNWIGPILIDSGQVFAAIDGENERDLQIWATQDVGAENIILDKEKLGKIGKGPGKGYMTRESYPSNIKAPSAGGRLVGRYKSAPVNVQIVD